MLVLFSDAILVTPENIAVAGVHIISSTLMVDG